MAGKSKESRTFRTSEGPLRGTSLAKAGFMLYCIKTPRCVPPPEYHPVPARREFRHRLGVKLGKKLLLPVDAVTIKDFPNPIDAPVEVEVYDADKMPADREGCDIGPKTQALFADAVKTAKTVVWNGPMGVFENPTLAAGTIAVAKALADTDATTIIGGGDSAAAVNQLGFGDKMTHISTGGGASLEFLEGKELPGVAAANDK